MKSTVLSDHGQKTYVLVFSSGDEVMAGLSAFAEREHVAASHFTAIGALSDATLGWFSWEQKTYKKIPVREQVEVLSLAGDIVQDKGKPKIHAHIVLAKSDGTARGGHLLEAHVRPTLELVLVESPKQLQRTMDPESGLALINVETARPAASK